MKEDGDGSNRLLTTPISTLSDFGLIWAHVVQLLPNIRTFARFLMSLSRLHVHNGNALLLLFSHSIGFNSHDD